MTTRIRPIGFFDSGIGGLSVWREVVRLLPTLPTVYVADSAYCPYGDRPAVEIAGRAVAITRFLLRFNCAPIVVACNTSSAAALDVLRTTFEVPFVGMEPAVKPAAQVTQTGHVGVLATAGTIQGALFQNTTRRYANGAQVHVQVGAGLVEQIETGRLDHPTTRALLRQYLDPLLATGVDQIVLGCTHYPLLMPIIREIAGNQAQIIDPATAVARQVQRVWSHLNGRAAPASLNDISGQPQHQFFTTGEARQIEFLEDIPGNQTVYFETVSL